jgi:threonyl-tRNA synthetase
VYVVLPDGKRLEIDAPRATVADVARRVGERLAKAALAGKVDGKLVDLAAEVAPGAQVAILTADSADGLYVLRHSTAHVMATAVKRLFPDVDLGIGPPIEDGFYYDFHLEHRLTEEDLEKIEAEMRKVVAEDAPFARADIARDDALARLRGGKQRFKVELVEQDLAAERTVSFYQDGDFADLCRGPHVPSTGRCKAWKLLSVSGAYWRGKETNPMMQRIYGTAWANDKDLQGYLRQLEEAKKRDHRKLGKELELFAIPEVTGPGLIFWLPKGAVIRGVIEDWLRAELKARGYEAVYTPHVVKETLFQVSGHLDNYAENMFPAMEIEGANYRVKPMNCPGHSMIYKSRLRSYRDLPLRLQEIANVYRYERSGTLHGLARVRGLTMDDAHIFCRPDQLADEIAGCVDFVRHAMKIFGLEAKVYLSTRPAKAIGSVEVWDHAIAALKEAAARTDLAYDMDEGGGAFYGPKLDFKFYDALGREWQGPTVQCDFNLPERFDLTYRGADGAEHRPVMVHRAILGTFERFMALIIEHYAGAFPLWLAPVQARVLPITDAQHERAREVEARLKAAGMRVELDARNEKLGAKVREAILEKIPYMLVIGELEAKQEDLRVAVSRRDGSKESMPLDQFIEEASKKIKERYVDPVGERWRRPASEPAGGQTY